MEGEKDITLHSISTLNEMQFILTYYEVGASGNNTSRTLIVTVDNVTELGLFEIIGVRTFGTRIKVSIYSFVWGEVNYVDEPEACYEGLL